MAINGNMGPMTPMMIGGTLGTMIKALGIGILGGKMGPMTPMMIGGTMIKALGIGILGGTMIQALGEVMIVISSLHWIAYNRIESSAG